MKILFLIILVLTSCASIKKVDKTAVEVDSTVWRTSLEHFTLDNISEKIDWQVTVTNLVPDSMGNMEVKTTTNYSIKGTRKVEETQEKRIEGGGGREQKVDIDVATTAIAEHPPNSPKHWWFLLIVIIVIIILIRK